VKKDLLREVARLRDRGRLPRREASEKTTGFPGALTPSVRFLCAKGESPAAGTGSHRPEDEGFPTQSRQQRSKSSKFFLKTGLDETAEGDTEGTIIMCNAEFQKSKSKNNKKHIIMPQHILSAFPGACKKTSFQELQPGLPIERNGVDGSIVDAN